jgi:hypothetical protein
MAEQHYRVTVGTYDLGLDEIHDPAGQQDIKIMPVVAGAGGGVGKILIGVALIAAAIVLAPAGAGFLGLGAGLKATVASGLATGFISAAASSAIGAIGFALVVGGVTQLVSPVPKVPQGGGSDNDPRKTYNFSGIQQTSRQGVPVPCVYGLTLVGSVVISAGTDTVQVTA